MPPHDSSQFLRDVQDLLLKPLLDGVERKIETSNAHQLERIEQIVTEQASTKTDVAKLKEDVSELQRLKLKLFGIASLIATIVGLIWGSALEWARKRGWIH